MANETVLQSGPWKFVRSTNDPFDDTPDELVDASNGYLPDPTGGCGFYQRPAFLVTAGASTGSQRANGQWHYTSTAGTEYNFLAEVGKLYRSDSAGNLTDVTPVGVTIDNGLTTRVYFEQINDQLIATDGVHRPWIGTNLGATPITGTYIDIDGAATAWTAFGAIFFYQGAIGFILNTIGGASNVVPRIGIVWCEPNQPAVGYTQSGYADFANLLQTSQRPLTRCYGLDSGLIVWRDQGIGLLSGPLNSFVANPTTQAISDDIGLLAPATVDRYINNVFFCDQFGRPQLIQGTTLMDPPLWLQLRSTVEAQTQAAGYATAVQNCAVGIVEPNLKLYLCAPWSSSSFGVNNYPPTTLYAFDAPSGTYMGRWTVSSGCGVTSLGIQRDANNTAQLWVTAESVPAARDTKLWQLKRLSDASWSDSTTAQTVSVTTGRIGYSSSLLWSCGQTGDLITMGPHAVQISVVTPYDNNTVEGTPSPQTSQDGTYRCTVGLDVRAARGIQVTATPTLGSTQWGVQRWRMVATSQNAGPLDA